ncbi:NTP transferase domain-containing protein [Flavobacterium pectinovorum]|uniref:nucleotidyltransferase family protein n=1 Tax=Flavobacterium pectinovorum TaxID=29533 RepID=UPI001FAC4CE1|nr:nucleotidyltransferase family protein [Flavobacterium pectinovorum]MCI9846018.1 nucleotidyltransferase family protein [Flavobacterium pectinovorum]
MNQIAIVILAAGNAKRMGQSKQLMPWRYSTLLGSVIANILSADADKFFVVLGAYRNEIERKIDLSQTTILINKNWQQGLGSSIAIATSEIDKKYPGINAVLFVLADQPFINSPHLNKIIELHNKEKDAIIITRKDDYRGVPVLFPKQFFSELMLLSNDEGAKQIINKNKNLVKEVVTQDDTTDIDTLESYVKLYKSNLN